MYRLGYSINNVVFLPRKHPYVIPYIWQSGGSRVIPNCMEEQRLTVWSKLTGMNVYDVNCSLKCIGSGVWKYIHMLIAKNINARVDEGGSVSREDLDFYIG